MYTLPLNKKKLADLVKKCEHHNVFPSDLPRYCPNPKQRPINDLLAELIDEAYEYLSIASEEEIQTLLDTFPSGIMLMLFRGKLGWEEIEQKRRIAFCYIIFELERHKYPFKQVVKDDMSKSVVLKTYPELKEWFDKDGLLHLSNKFSFYDWGIGYQDHIFPYHQLLRDGYTASFNDGFLSQFIDYYQQTNKMNQFRIAIDHSKFVSKQTYSQILEFAAGWYGVPFKLEKIDNPNAVGLTVLKRDKMAPSGLPNKFERTEFFWSFRRGIKTFQIEEISTYSYRFEHYFFNRYLHSERNIVEKNLRHADGAIKVYLRENYPKRTSSSMPDEFKSHTKIKLWRIDGDIDVRTWNNLISFFYCSNDMVPEYLNPEEFKRLTKDQRCYKHEI